MADCWQRSYYLSYRSKQCLPKRYKVYTFWCLAWVVLFMVWCHFYGRVSAGSDRCKVQERTHRSYVFLALTHRWKVHTKNMMERKCNWLEQTPHSTNPINLFTRCIITGIYFACSNCIFVTKYLFLRRRYLHFCSGIQTEIDHLIYEAIDFRNPSAIILALTSSTSVLEKEYVHH